MNKFFLIIVGFSVFVLANFTRDNVHQIVLDDSTKLQWQDNNTSIQMEWKVAIKYCEELTLGDYVDWRLPNIIELNSLVDDKQIPAINRTFQHAFSAYYWTSTTTIGYLNYAWYISFFRGYHGYIPKKNHTSLVRCVRTGF